MTDMLERVAKALMFAGYAAVTPGSTKTADEVWDDLADDHHRDAARIRARAALLAALDPEDEETVSWIACELSTGEDIVYQVIASLRDRVAKGGQSDAE